MMTMTMMMIGLKGTAILLAAGLLSLLLSRASASVRHLVWTAGLGALLVLPVLEAARLPLEIPVAVPWMSATSPAEAVPFVEPIPPVEPVPEAQAGVPAYGAQTTLPVSRARAVAPVPQARASERVPESRSTPAPTLETPSAVLEVSSDGFAPGLGSRYAPQSASEGQRGSDTEPATTRTPMAATVWALGALLLLAVSLFGQLGAYRVTVADVRPASAAARRRLATLATESGAKRSVRLVVSPRMRVPATWGLGRSTVVLPEHYASWSPQTLDRVLLHELAHVERGDCRSRLVGELARALYWPNPLTWVALERQRTESERACDDRVLTRGDAPSDYAQDLVGIARSLRSGRSVPSAAMAMAGRSGVAGRVRAILDPGKARSHVGRKSFAAAAAIAVALSASTAGLVPVATAQERPEVQERPRPPQPPDTPPLPDTRQGPDAPVRPDAPQPPRPPVVVPLSVLVEQPTDVPPSLRTAYVEFVGAPPPVLATRATLVAMPLTRQSQELCVFRDGGPRSTSTNIDDDRTRIRWETDSCRVEVEFEGEVEFAQDDSDIVRMANGARFEIEERVGRTSRRARLEGEGGGGIERRYWVDGDARDWGPDADRWIGQILPQLFRHTTINAPARVRRMLEAGGPDRVFEEVALIPSDHVSRRYLELLMDHADLSEAQYARVIESAGDLESDHNKGELLLSVVERAGLRPAFQEPMLGAAAGIESDHQKTRVLQALLESPLSSEQLDAVVRTAQSIESDHNLGQVLSAVAAEGRLSDAGRAAFMETLESLESDHQHAMVLGAFLDAGPLTTAELSQVLAMTEGLDSDHQRATVLQRVAREYPLTGDQVTAYLRAASEIDSDHQLATTAEAIIRRAEFTSEQLELVLWMADDIDSDHQRSMVLQQIIERRALAPAEVERLVEVAKRVDSDHNLSETLSLLANDEDLAESGVLSVLDAAADIGSDHNRSSVMLTVARRYDVQGAARTLYMELADDMSRHQRDEVLAAIVR